MKVELSAKITRRNQTATVQLGAIDLGWDNSSAYDDALDPLVHAPPIHLIDTDPSRQEEPLHNLFTKMVVAGMKREMLHLVSAVVPGLEDLVLLTEQDTPVLHLLFETHSIPVAAGGDGIKSLVRLCLALAGVKGGRALLEEPEVHQHPAAIWQSAAAIVAAVQRGAQVFVSTHSLDLIDSLVTEAAIRGCLDKLSLCRLRLERGQLLSSRLSGPDIAFARAEIQDDLR